MKYITVPGIVLTRICGRFFLVTPKETMEISETGYICLKRLGCGANIDDICNDLEELFDIDDREKLLFDVRDFIKDLLKNRLLMRCCG